MTLQVKERIVGIVVIICLILIWGPFFLGKKSSEPQTPKNDKNAVKQVSNQNSSQPVQMADESKLQGTPLVDNTLPPQTTEEQIQSKQPPVLPMPAVTQAQPLPAIEDEDVALEPVVLEWSPQQTKSKNSSSANASKKVDKAASMPKEVPEEEQVAINIQPAVQNHDQESNEEVNDEKLLKTSEANEAKLKKLFEKNEKAAVSAKVVKAPPATKTTIAKTESNHVTKSTQSKTSKTKETKSVVSNTNAQNSKWIVEVATLSNPHYVAVLKQRLAKNGFTAFSRAGRSSNGNTVYYVWVGAENNREQAINLAKRLEKIAQLSGKVMKSTNVG